MEYYKVINFLKPKYDDLQVLKRFSALPVHECYSKLPVESEGNSDSD
jgi:hypothetical protein